LSQGSRPPHPPPAPRGGARRAILLSKPLPFRRSSLQSYPACFARSFLA
jgi:hypothetical protein